MQSHETFEAPPYSSGETVLPEDEQSQWEMHPELMRVREVFRYLEPWEPNIRPTLVTKPPDDGGEEPGQPAGQAQDGWTPVGCEDTALAAFAQLGALRLGVQRAFISLVSKDQEIVLAEATRTLSLQSDQVHTPEDALWLGTTSFPRGQGMGCIGLKHWRRSCEARESPGDDDHYHTDGVTNHYHIISDMRHQPEYHGRLFVRHARNIRFYAAVPIRTPSGTVIGTYAVMDDRPRYGISDREMDFLEDVADTVMSHLEAKRAMMQRQRGDRLVKGIALFNTGKTSLREWWLTNYTRPQRGANQRRRRLSLGEEELRREHADEEFGQTYRAEELTARGRLISTSPASADRTQGDDAPETPSGLDEPTTTVTDHESDTKIPVESEVEPANDSPTSPGHLPQRASESFDLAKEIEGVFARASNLMRESLNAEGVLFIDTDFPRSEKERRGRYRRGAGDSKTEDGQDSVSTTTEPDDSSAETPGSVAESFTSDRNPLEKADCSLLGFSTKIKSSVRGFNPSQKHSSLPKKLMERLLRRYPHGKVFNYHNGRVLSSSSGGEGSTTGTGSKPQQPMPRAKARSKEARDAAAIAEIINEPRSVAFLPLWDTRRDRWRTGILVWNELPNRFLDLQEDVTYMSAFGHSLMSELARLEVIAADQAKATFISSVSHELRSPLHGVLAGVEFLQESRLDIYQQEMAMTISMAGQTLLDTINNILDFTKINSFTDVQRTERTDRDLQRHIAFKSVDIGEVGVTSDVDLAALTENIVDTLVTANQFQSSAMKKSLRSSRRSSRASVISTDGGSSHANPTYSDDEDDVAIMVVLDIMKRPSWRINISPGSWTRIITNLVGNSFKYTKAGSITVGLRAGKRRPDGKVEVILSVTDTGQGISQEFQKHHAFTPFMQENSHSVGTGLGLSIVKQVLEDIGGHINIQSEVGRGTTVTISLAADFIPVKPPGESDSESGLKGLKGLHVGFAGTVQGIEQRKIRSIVSKTCSEWLGCSFKNIEGLTDSSDADVTLMAGADYAEWCQNKRARRNTEPRGQRRSSSDFAARIVVLNSLLEPETRRTAMENRGSVIFINQPFGPRKLCRAIKAALSADEQRTLKEEEYDSDEQQDHIDPDANTRRPRDPRPCIADSAASSERESHSSYSSSRSGRSSTKKDASEVEPQTQPSSPNPSLGKILLVEDNAVNMKLLMASMRKLRRPYETAENGLQAVEKYAAAPSSFTLILMDMSMPIMDGFTATETIRVLENKNRWRRVLIIALTGVASEEARQRAFKTGVDTFLTKPAPMQKLREIVENLEDAES